MPEHLQFCPSSTSNQGEAALDLYILISHVENGSHSPCVLSPPQEHRVSHVTLASPQSCCGAGGKRKVTAIHEPANTELRTASPPGVSSESKLEMPAWPCATCLPTSGRTVTCGSFLPGLNTQHSGIFLFLPPPQRLYDTFLAPGYLRRISEGKEYKKGHQALQHLWSTNREHTGHIIFAYSCKEIK